MFKWAKKKEAEKEQPVKVQQAYQPLLYYRSENIAGHWGFHENSLLNDVQKDALADPNSAEHQEHLSDLLMYRSRSPGVKISFLPMPYLGFQFDEKALFEAITKAITLTPEDKGDQLLRRQSKLNVLLEKRFVLKGKMEDLKTALQSAEIIMELTPKDDPVLAYRLTNLANLLAFRFEREGSADDIDKAIECGEEAVKIASQIKSKDDDTLEGRLLHNLAVKFELRSQYTGSLADLDEAISKSGQALKILSQRCPDRLLYISARGNMLASRFQRTRKLRDLNEAIGTMEKVAAEIHKNEPIRPKLLDNLGNRYLDRYQYTGDAADLGKAIEKSKDALRFQDAIFPRNPDSGKYTTSLAKKYAIRAKKTGSSWDAFQMQTYAEAGLKHLPEGHPNRAEALEYLGDVAMFRYEHEAHVTPEVREKFNDLMKGPRKANGQPMDLGEMVRYGAKVHTFKLADDISPQMTKAIDFWLQGARLKNGRPLTRISIFKKLGDIQIYNVEWKLAAQMFTSAINLWPRLNLHALNREDVEFVIGKLSGLGSLASLCILEGGGSAKEALLALENGRGIIAGLVISSRSDISRLKQTNEQLYNRYMELRNAVSSPLSSRDESGNTTNDSIATAISRRDQDLLDLERVEKEIRSLKDLSHFHTSQSVAELIRLAQFGPIVCFNTTERASTAFMVTTSGIRSVLLPGLKYEDLQTHVSLLVRGRSITIGKSSDTDRRNEKLRIILGWLWREAVEPVLSALGLISFKTPARLPRLWWVTCGLMGLLPLHAAGSGWGTSRENTLSHVVSSYIPTFKALAYARQRVKPLSRKLLVVSMPNTPGFKRPLRVEKEVKEVKAHFDSPVLLNSPSREEVRESLKSANIAHFICHGTSEAFNPSNSGLVLTDGRLTVRDLAALSLDQAQIAYLSACSTADNKTRDLVDESIHIASAFNLAGFPHVVGTFWPASNKIAERVAPKFYEILNEGLQKEENNSDVVARALQEAVKSLWCSNNEKMRASGERNISSDNVIGWAPYIHIGA